ncbi:MAG: hypothetical protein B6242_06255 [Anaerolineaceae bacterium 4572_78]|nr:MAG: hypothetical protein B6242_06255 [Anaerolineaceae bacterium 4572_78]
MFQVTMIIGRVTSKITINTLPNDMDVANFSVACNRSFYSGEEARQETIWFQVSVFGRQARPCVDMLRKGSVVHVMGRLRPDAKTGNPRIWTSAETGSIGTSYEIIASNVKFISGYGKMKEVTKND